MKRKLRRETERRPDETVGAMLERHVRDRDGSAAIQTRTDESLRKRLATSAQ